MPVMQDARSRIDAPRWSAACVILTAALVMPAISPAATPPALACPDKVSPPRDGVIAPPGWMIKWDDSMESLLVGARIVSGTSLQSHLTDLRPKTRFENMDKKWTERKIDKIWNFPIAHNRASFWIFCQYQMSAIQLFRKIPSSVQACKLTGEYLGNPYPGTTMTIECR